MSKGNMRVALVNTYYSPDDVGGTEVCVRSLAQGLRERGVSVLVVATGRRDSRETVDGIPVTRIAHENVYWPPESEGPKLGLKALWHAKELYKRRVSRRVVEAVKGFAPDVVHLHNLVAISPAIYRELEREMVAVGVCQTLHDYWITCFTRRMIDVGGDVCERLHWYCRVRGKLIGSLAAGIDAFVSPSRFLGDLLLREGVVEEGKIRVIPNGVSSPAEVGSPGGVEKKGVRFLYLGALTEHKGVRLLLEAIPDAGIGAEIRIAGDGPLRPEVEGHSGVQYCGFVGGKEKERLLHEADVLIIPSQWRENNPMAAIEALHYGLAVIGTDIGGIPELVRHRENGWLVPVGCRRSLSSAIREAAERREVIAQYGTRSRVLAGEYSLDAMIDRYCELYREVAVPSDVGGREA